MYIEKVFSNYEADENLYSVIMDEEELALFSELQESLYSKNDDNNGAKGALIGAGLTAGAAGAGYGAFKGAQAYNKSHGAWNQTKRGIKGIFQGKGVKGFHTTDVEKVSRGTEKYGKKAAKWAKKNKALAALAAGGALAGGAGLGYLAEQ